MISANTLGSIGLLIVLVTAVAANAGKEDQSWVSEGSSSARSLADDGFNGPLFGIIMTEVVFLSMLCAGAAFFIKRNINTDDVDLEPSRLSPYDV